MTLSIGFIVVGLQSWTVHILYNTTLITVVHCIALLTFAACSYVAQRPGRIYHSHWRFGPLHTALRQITTSGLCVHVRHLPTPVARPMHGEMYRLYSTGRYRESRTSTPPLHLATPGICPKSTKNCGPPPHPSPHSEPLPLYALDQVFALPRCRYLNLWV